MRWPAFVAPVDISSFSLVAYFRINFSPVPPSSKNLAAKPLTLIRGRDPFSRDETFESRYSFLSRPLLWTSMVYKNIGILLALRFLFYRWKVITS